MRRISTPTAAQDLFGPGKHGFRNGDPANAILATRLQAEWFNSLQEEVAAAVEQTGQALDPENNGQLSAAIEGVVDRKAPVATKAEAETADELTANNTKRMTPLRVLQAIKARLINATEVVVGMLRIGTQAEINAGALDAVAVTPLKLEVSRPRKAHPKAWVNFNGTGTVAIRDSFNVSSITDNGVGDYTVNLATPMPSINYAAVTAGSATDAAISGINCTKAYARTTSSFKVGSTGSSSGTADFIFVDVAVFSS